MLVLVTVWSVWSLVYIKYDVRTNLTISGKVQICMEPERVIMLSFVWLARDRRDSIGQTMASLSGDTIRYNTNTQIHKYIRTMQGQVEWQRACAMHTYYVVHFGVRRHFGITVRHFVTLVEIRHTNWQFAGE